MMPDFRDFMEFYKNSNDDRENCYITKKNLVLNRFYIVNYK